MFGEGGVGGARGEPPQRSHRVRHSRGCQAWAAAAGQRASAAWRPRRGSALVHGEVRAERQGYARRQHLSPGVGPRQRQGYPRRAARYPGRVAHGMDRLHQGHRARGMHESEKSWGRTSCRCSTRGRRRERFGCGSQLHECGEHLAAGCVADGMHGGLEAGPGHPGDAPRADGGVTNRPRSSAPPA